MDGSGAGKTRFYGKPNVMQCGDSSYVILDPKAEILRDTGNLLEKEGYENEVTIYQSKIADELNRIDDYDAVISTTIVPDSIKDKVINGLGLLTGINADQILNDVKERLGL